ncbi:MAG: sodium:solute symporter family protein [Eubacteriales bacterium]|nr:sodium:solute symporter family protein [Eubacteriales bacterium]
MKGIDIGIVVLYMIGMLAVGVLVSRKQSSMETYYVAGRRLGTVSIACLWVSCWIGGASVIGTSAKAYDMGVTAVWYVGILAVGCAVFALVFAKKVKVIGDQLQNLSYPDFIEARYDGNCRLIATVCTLIGMIGVTSSQLVASGSILNTITGWGNGPSFAAAAVVLILYTSLGGYLAVTYTDWIQVFLLIMGIVIGVPFAAHAMGGLDRITELPSGYFDVGAWGWPTIAAFALSSLLSFFTTMDSYTRCMAAKDAATARKGGILAACLILPIALGATYEGMAAKVLLPDLADGNNALIRLILATFPTGVRGLVITGIFAAIMSSADISILTASANITRDIYQRYVRPDAPDRKIVRIGVLSSLFVGAVSLLTAWLNPDIMDILLITFTFLSAGLFVPTFCGFFWKRAGTAAAFYSMLLSMITVTVWYAGNLLGWGAVFAVDALWPGLAVSLVVFLGLTLTSRQSEEEKKRIEEIWFRKER